VELNDAEAAKFVAKNMLENGVVANRTHEVVIRMLPPFIIEKKHVDIATKAFDKALLGWEATQKSAVRSGGKKG
jgi:acetylornithine/N-succinyldiaminopimelate aminotransferase